MDYKMVFFTFLIAIVLAVQPAVTTFPTNKDLARYTAMQVNAGGKDIDFSAI
jgi:hypothetical protein